MKRVSVVGAIAGILVLALAPTASAHEHRPVGRMDVVVGWSEEPAVAGFKNAVSISLLDPDGEPVTNAKLKVQIEAAGKTSESLTLAPAFGSPGDYEATTIPTVAGVYTFHITGTVGRTRFDQRFTSGDKTFDSPANPTELEFPDKPPTRADLNRLIVRTGARVSDEADDAASKATLGLILGAAGLLFGLVALVVALSKRRATA